MHEKIHVYEYPEFLKNDEFVFDIKKVLKDSLYYPGSSADGTLVKEFRGNFHSFINVDYKLSKENFERALVEYPFKGFSIIHKESIDAKELVPTAFNSEHSNDFGKDCEPFCEWMIFEHNSTGARFSLLHIYVRRVLRVIQIYM